MAWFGNLLTVVLIGYLAYSTYEIGRLWFPAECDPNVSDCVRPGFSFAQPFDTQSTNDLFLCCLLCARLEMSLPRHFEVPWKEGRDTARSLHLAILATPAGSPAKAPSTNDLKTSLYTTYELIKFMPVIRQKKKFLLGSNTTNDIEEEQLEKNRNAGQAVAHFKPLMKVRLVNDHRSYAVESLPPDLAWHFMDHTRKSYRPFFYVDELHVFRNDLIPVSYLNATADPTVSFIYSPTSIGAYRLLQQLQGSMALMQSQFGFQEKETEQVLMIFSPDNIYRLMIIGFVSVLHTLFAFLSFKNDVGFWRGREDLAGLSRRSVIGHAICSVIILLFLYDSPGTSWLVLGTMLVSTIIDLWKVSKVLRFSSREHQNTSQENETDLHDSQGMYYLSLILYPLVIIWAIYSLIENAHRSWWSWLISSAANGVYAFGFLMMTPQIFINYKLKSVAHLPWRAMTYKVFNTFVDDIFAFVIDMPTIHRLATLRDDLIFFIYLYQRYIYPVDKKRANEYGFSAEDPKGVKPFEAPIAAAADSTSPSTEQKLKTE